MLTEQETQHIINGFFDKTLPLNEWTHLAHLIVGLHVVCEHDLDSSVAIMRDGIKTYNVAAGGENTDTGGYHESITIFFVHALCAFVNQTGRDMTFAELATRLQSSVLVQQSFMFGFYSKDRLFTVEARLGWVEPDLRPLADLHELGQPQQVS